MVDRRIAEPPLAGSTIVDVVRYYTETAREALGEAWDLELIPLIGKNPRVNGSEWQTLASSDPALVLQQLKACGTAGRLIDGLGALMNRHITFDVDHPEALPEALRSILAEGLQNSTRPGRTHYVFRVPEGRRFGGSQSKLGPAFGVRARWGEVKAWNSQVRIWSPNSDGTHVRLTPGPIPMLPPVLWELLLPPLAAGEMVTEGELFDWLRDHRESRHPRWLGEDISKLEVRAVTSSKYEAMVQSSFAMAGNVAGGAYPGMDAYEGLLEAYRQLCEREDDWDGDRLVKYQDAWRGAAAKWSRDPKLIDEAEAKRRGWDEDWDPESNPQDAAWDSLFAQLARAWGHVYVSATGSSVDVEDVDVRTLLEAPDSDVEVRPDSGGVAPGPGARDAGSETRRDAFGDDGWPPGHDADDGATERDVEPLRPGAEAEGVTSKPPAELAMEALRDWIHSYEEERPEVTQDVRRKAIGFAMFLEALEPDQQVTWLKKFMAKRGGEKKVWLEQLDQAELRADINELVRTVRKARSKLPVVDEELTVGFAARRAPEMFLRDDGVGLVYLGGASHEIVGDAGSGKTSLACWGAAQVLRAGGAAIWVDLEMGKARLGGLLARFGVTQAEASRFRVIDLTSVGSNLVDVQQRVRAMADDGWTATGGVAPSLLVLDSMSKAIARIDDSVEGGENSAQAVLEIADRFVMRINSMGISTVVIDHVGHSDKTRARGSSAKIQQTDVSYSVQVTRPWTESKSGSGLIWCRKDRDGFHEMGAQAAVMTVEPVLTDPEGKRRTEIRLWAPGGGGSLAAAASAAETRIGRLKEQILELLEKELGGLSANKIRETVGGRKTEVLDALEELMDDDEIRRTGSGPSGRYSL